MLAASKAPSCSGTQAAGRRCSLTDGVSGCSRTPESASFEAWLAPLQARADALAEVRGLAEPFLLGRLVLERRGDAVGEVAAQSRPDRTDRQWTGPCNLAGQRAGCRPQRIRRSEPVAETEPKRLL